MMILSRAWYFILAVIAAASYYVVALAVGQYNRQITATSDEALKSDAQVVGWALQIDARRRLDNLFLSSVDENIRKALKAANGKEPIAAAAREDGKKGVTAFNEKLPADYKFDALFVVDRDGRVVAQIGYDAANAAPDFELGGYPVVNDALHGYLRDDNWALDTRLFRVVARPVEDEVGQPPLGAVVGFKAVDADYCRELSKRVRANVAFFAGGARVGQGAEEGFPASIFDDLNPEFARGLSEEGLKSGGRSDVRPIGPKKTAAAIFSRIQGEAGEGGAGFAVARQRVLLPGMMGFLSGADDTDKKNVSYLAIALILLVGIGLGFLFSVFEHSLPLRELKSQSDALRSGKIDALQLARLRAGLRDIAQSINQGIERIVERGGGAGRKPADLEAILGPVPAQPQMSAFAFPLPDSSAGAVAGGQAGGATPAFPPATSAPNLPGLPAPGGGPPRILPPPPRAPGPPASGPLPDSAQSPGRIPPPPAKQPAVAPPAARTPFDSEPEDEQTRVGVAPHEVISEASGAHVLPSGSASAARSAAASPPSSAGRGAAADPSDWVKIFEEFVKTKRQCGEPVEGLTYEKFRGTLAKNRDALIARHKCTLVKFTVYVKDGRASLKATPVRE